MKAWSSLDQSFNLYWTTYSIEHKEKLRFGFWKKIPVQVNIFAWFEKFMVVGNTLELLWDYKILPTQKQDYVGRIPLPFYSYHWRYTNHKPSLRILTIYVKPWMGGTPRCSPACSYLTVILLESMLLKLSVHIYLSEEGGGGGGGMEDLAMPIHAITPTASTIHPSTSYLKSLSFFFGRCTTQWQTQRFI